MAASNKEQESPLQGNVRSKERTLKEFFTKLIIRPPSNPITLVTEDELLTLLKEFLKKEFAEIVECPAVPANPNFAGLPGYKIISKELEVRESTNDRFRRIHGRNIKIPDFYKICALGRNAEHTFTTDFLIFVLRKKEENLTKEENYPSAIQNIFGNVGSHRVLGYIFNVSNKFIDECIKDGSINSYISQKPSISDTNTALHTPEAEQNTRGNTSIHTSDIPTIDKLNIEQSDSDKAGDILSFNNL